MATWGKEEWHVEHRSHSGVVIADHRMANQIDFDMNYNTPSSCTYELALSDPLVTRDSFAPYRTDAFLWRGQDLIISGPHTSRKWSHDKPDVVQVAMQDWMHILEKLYAPITLTGGFQIDINFRKTHWKSWPTDPVNTTGAERNGIFLDVIIRELLAYRNAVDPLQWDVVVMPTGGNISKRGFHTMEGLDSKTMYMHIKELSELHLGFDFRCRFVSTNHIEVQLWHHPGLGVKSTGKPLINFTKGDQFASFAWEDTGPKATRTFGLAQGHGNVGRLAAVSVYTPSDTTYRQLESQEDVGDISDYYQYDNSVAADEHIINRLTGSRGHFNRGPVHNIAMSFYTSIYPNWWTNVDPGDRVHVDYDLGFHRINSDYTILGYSGAVSAQGDELITPDLERVLPYGTSTP